MAAMRYQSASSVPPINQASAQEVFWITERRHFKIDALKHFILKCGRVL